MSDHAHELDPVVVIIDEAEPSLTFDEWVSFVGANEPVDIGISAVELLAEARQHGEI